MEDEFASEWTKIQYLKNREYINKRRKGLIPPRDKKVTQGKGYHQIHIKVCPKCNKKRELTIDYHGNKMCSTCLLNSL